MRIATFNINGIKARLPRLIEWLDETQPDVACLQEIKSQDDGFPASEFEAIGYQALWHGQKSFNGVAILADGVKPVETRRGLPDLFPEDGEDDHARYLEADINGVRVGCIYLPNGNPLPGPKFDYKLRWMERLRAHAADLWAQEIPTALVGDYNVIPQGIDALHPENWRDDALFQPESRGAFWRLQNLGLTEAFRARNQAAEQFTFWDFQRGAWQRNDGIRIDHFLLSPQCADLLEDCQIDKEVRGRDKPYVATPVSWAEVEAGAEDPLGLEQVRMEEVLDRVADLGDLFA